MKSSLPYFSKSLTLGALLILGAACSKSVEQRPGDGGGGGGTDPNNLIEDPYLTAVKCSIDGVRDQQLGGTQAIVLNPNTWVSNQPGTSGSEMLVDFRCGLDQEKAPGDKLSLANVKCWKDGVANDCPNLKQDKNGVVSGTFALSNVGASAGKKSFQVRALSAEGVQGFSLPMTWNIDAGAPIVSVPTVKLPMTQYNPIFQTTASDVGGSGIAFFSCALVPAGQPLVGNEFVQCGTPNSVSLTMPYPPQVPNSAHVFYVKATDRVGNESTVRASATITTSAVASIEGCSIVDASPPTPREGKLFVRSFSFVCQSAQPAGVSDIMCSSTNGVLNPDGATYSEKVESCKNGAVFTSGKTSVITYDARTLVEGEQTFSVYLKYNLMGQDQLGVSDERTWVADSTVPILTITPHADTSVQPRFEIDANEALSSTRCKLNYADEFGVMHGYPDLSGASDFGPCDPRESVVPEKTYQFGIKPGFHYYFEVEGTDLAGNSSIAKYDWVVKPTSGPSCQITGTSLTDKDAIGHFVSRQPSETISFVCNSTGIVKITQFTCTLNGAPFECGCPDGGSCATAGTESLESSVADSNLGREQTIRIPQSLIEEDGGMAYDLTIVASNEYDTPGSDLRFGPWTADGQAPVITHSVPETSRSAARLSFAVDDVGGSGSGVNFEKTSCTLLSSTGVVLPGFSVLKPCVSPVLFTGLTPNAQYKLRVNATDYAGNVAVSADSPVFRASDNFLNAVCSLEGDRRVIDRVWTSNPSRTFKFRSCTGLVPYTSLTCDFDGIKLPCRDFMNGNNLEISTTVNNHYSLNGRHYLDVLYLPPGATAPSGYKIVNHREWRLDNVAPTVRVANPVWSKRRVKNILRRTAVLRYYVSDKGGSGKDVRSTTCNLVEDSSSGAVTILNPRGCGTNALAFAGGGESAESYTFTITPKDKAGNAGALKTYRWTNGDWKTADVIPCTNNRYTRTCDNPLPSRANTAAEILAAPAVPIWLKGAPCVGPATIVCGNGGGGSNPAPTSCRAGETPVAGGCLSATVYSRGAPNGLIQETCSRHGKSGLIYGPSVSQPSSCDATYSAGMGNPAVLQFSSRNHAACQGSFKCYRSVR